MILTSLVVAGAISAATLAQNGNYCMLPWDRQCCPIPNSLTLGISAAELTICNEKSSESRYDWLLSDTNLNGLKFLPDHGSVVLGPGDCITIPFTIICKGDPGTLAIYDATIDKIDIQSGVLIQTFGCQGSVFNRSDWKIDGGNGPIIIMPVPPLGEPPLPSAPLDIVVANIGLDVSAAVTLRVDVMGDFSVNPPEILLEGGIAAGGSFAVDSFFDVSYDGTGFPPGPPIGDILFWIDFDGNGAMDVNVEVIGSISILGELAPLPCPGDINGDGVVDTADLGILLGQFGLICP